MTTADHIRDQIDNALHDDAVSADAMRSTPRLAVPWPRVLVMNCDSQAARQALEGATRAVSEMGRAFQAEAPRLRHAAAEAAAGFRALREANDWSTGRREP